MIKKVYNSFVRKIGLPLFTKLQYHKNDEGIKQLKKRGLFEIGKNTYGKIIIDNYEGSEQKVSIGDYCSISRNVRFINGGIHPVDWVSLYPFRIRWGMDGALDDGMPASKGPITVKNDVWIGTGVTILSGVTIGNGAIVMAGSIVTKDVPAYTIVGGIPAKIIKTRFSDSEIEALERISWWDWPKEKIEKNVHLLSSNSMEEFIEQHSL